MFTTIRPSSPDPSTYAGFPDDMDKWVCQQWEDYYYRMRDSLGQDAARSYWNTDANRIGFWSEFHNCRYNCDWNRLMKSFGLDTGSNLLSNAFCISEGVGEGVSSVFNPKTVKAIITIAGIGIGLYAADKVGLLPKGKRK